jgi:hypothetical protein
VAGRVSRLFGLTLRESGSDPKWVAVDTVPYVIGRAAEANLRVEAPGVWDRHLVLELDATEGLVAIPSPEALTTFEGQTIQRHRVRMGDVLGLGSVTIQFLLTPVVRRRTGLWEVAVWLLFAAVIGYQVFLVLRFLP